MTLSYQIFSENINFSLHQDVNPDLKKWLNSIIREYYTTFDGAHNTKHAYDVIKRGMQYTKEYQRLHPSEDINLNIVYAACALHDIGLSVDRETHEENSGKIIRSERFKKHLRRWFTDQQIEQIAIAVEDHRNSMKGDPRTIYGRIVSQADRNFAKNIDGQLIRTVKYGRAHFMNETPQYRFNNSIQNTIYKYGKPRIRLDIPSVRKKANKTVKMLSNKKKVYKHLTKLMIKNGSAPKGWKPTV